MPGAKWLEVSAQALHQDAAFATRDGRYGAWISNNGAWYAGNCTFAVGVFNNSATGRNPNSYPAPSNEAATATASLSPLAPSPEPTPTPTVVDPAVRAKMIVDFKDDTKATLSQVAAQADIFKELTSLSGAKELPGPISEGIAALAEKARDFRSKVGYETALGECKTETATVDGLIVFAKVGHELAAGDAATANSDLNAFHRDHADTSGEAQKPLWDWMESTRKLCARLEEEAKIHLERAQSLSAEGKSGEAIGEYQKACRIFPDPALAQTIKRLREESLGL